MTSLQAAALGGTLVIVLGIAAIVQLGWIPEGRAKTVSIFVAGVAASACLAASGLPPKWLNGTRSAFGPAIYITLGACIYRTPAEKAFGVPLHLGMGLTLLLVNVVQAIRRVL